MIKVPKAVNNPKVDIDLSNCIKVCSKQEMFSVIVNVDCLSGLSGATSYLQFVGF